ncbi:MAG: hypothetical protein EOM50_04295 [Erysipelotrichia bacterium]|nr:hypothetical protein [Erysipelotrichia bacterium]
MKQLKYAGYASLIWIVLFLFDYIYHLFQIEKSGVVTTLMGLKITTEMTISELNTQFSLTIQALLIYIIFIAICVALFTVARKKKG